MEKVGQRKRGGISVFGGIQNTTGQGPVCAALNRGLDQVNAGGPFQPKLFYEPWRRKGKHKRF